MKLGPWKWRLREQGNDISEERWSGLSESNRHLNLGKVPYYHYTKAALPIYNTWTRAATSSREQEFRQIYETWLMRAALTTGDLRWRSAKRVALSLSV